MALIKAVAGQLIAGRHLELRANQQSLPELLQYLGISCGGNLTESLPFCADDATVGVENEFQTVVIGKPEDVDLALTIGRSNFYRNIIQRIIHGRSPKHVRNDLEKYLKENADGVWENSNVRVPVRALNDYACAVLRKDLQADKGDSNSGTRTDIDRFFCRENAEVFARIPVSYLLKIALADLIGRRDTPALVKSTGERLLPMLINDNTSPEQLSSYIVTLSPARQMGRAVAKEVAQRFLLTQLLVAYANRKLQLKDHGQECAVYFSALPPERQRQMNNLVSDAFYRELFMNPCLSGWDQGESKHRYMHLCHSVLSRSYLNTTGRLRDAGIARGKRVVGPNLSSIALANNGTHISIGSIRMGQRLARDVTGHGRIGEKYTGDLAIKIVEHFLPLFSGIYSAAPYRIGFQDFHPEKVLGFLPHELDSSHLRMIWQSWCKKAQRGAFGSGMTPSGIESIDRLIAGVFGIKGDFVPDYRLIDYFLALPSTEQSPALNGEPDNDARLKADLGELGVYDPHMTMYLPYRQRAFADKGYSGFEGRYYSVFPQLQTDLAHAAELQTLITALAYKYMASGVCDHGGIPDDPASESERRQFLFAAALGLPFCYVRKETNNVLLRRILQKTRRIRPSKYYRGYLKIPMAQYRAALLRILWEDATDLIEMMQLQGTLADLEYMLDDQAESAAGRLARGVLEQLNVSNPLDVSAAEFNQAAEHYHRNQLRLRHIEEGFSFLMYDAFHMDIDRRGYGGGLRQTLNDILGAKTAVEFTAIAKRDFAKETIASETLIKLTQLLLVNIAHDAYRADRQIADGDAENAA